MALHDTSDFMDLIGILKAFHPKAAEYAFFSSAQDRPDIRPQKKSEYIGRLESYQASSPTIAVWN